MGKKKFFNFKIWKRKNIRSKTKIINEQSETTVTTLQQEKAKEQQQQYIINAIAKIANNGDDYDNHDWKNHNSDEELFEYCRKQRQATTIACLQRLNEHINTYMTENLFVHSFEFVQGHQDPNQRRIVLRQYGEDCEIIYQSDNLDDNSSSFSYEDWVRQCHPENVLKRKRNSTKFRDVDEERASHAQGEKGRKEECQSLSKYIIDKRFYYEESHHRKLWNACVEAHGYPELKIDARPNLNDLCK